MQILKARYILPVISEPIENGGIVIDDGKIKEIGFFENLKTRHPNLNIKDLGNAFLMPGFVNVHSHAEYTLMRGLIGGMNFFNWIKRLAIYHENLTIEEIIISSKLGVMKMISSGITTVADSTFYGTPLEVFCEFGLKGIVYQEVFGPDDRVNQVALDDLKRKIDLMQEKAVGTDLTVGVSPHSVYTVSESLFRKVCDYAAKNNLPVSIHAVETEDEVNFIREGSGFIAEHYKNRGIPWVGKKKTVIEYLRDIGVFDSGARIQLVHLTQATEKDFEIIAEYNLSAALCPCSNAWLGVGISPISGIIKHGIFAGFGTDSEASNGGLSILDEMRCGAYLQRGKHRNVDASKASEMIELATIRGAKSINLCDKIGSLESGKNADLIAVSLDNLNAIPLNNFLEYVVFSCRSSDIFMTMVDGEIVYENGEYSNIDKLEIIKQSNDIAYKLQNIIV
jgi:aminodeoxyfutalosine deaminase